MSDVDKPEDWEPWMDNPLMVDQKEGFTFEEPPLYVMQTKQPYGGWEPFHTARQNRDEVTVHQAYHLNNGPEQPVRVLSKRVIWTVDEVPGHGEGQTPPEEILARNEQITRRLLDEQKNQKPA